MNTPQQLLSGEAQLVKMGYDVLGYQPRELQVVRYDESKHRRMWEACLPNTVNGNLFHTRQFLGYHPPDRFQDHSLLFFQGEELLALAAGEEKGGTWSAHRYSSHGGIVVVSVPGAESAIDLVSALLTYARKQSWTGVSLRFSPSCLHRDDLSCLFWALSVFGFSADERELTWYVAPGSSSNEELLGSYHDSARRAVRKAQKSGLSFGPSGDFDGFWALLEANLARRFEVQPTHTLAEIKQLIDLCPGSISLWGVSNSEQRLLAGSVVFELTSSGAQTFYFAQDYQYQELRPMALLMYGLSCEFTITRGQILDFGVITAHGGKELNLGLSRFKMGFAARPAIRRRFSLELPNE